MQTKQQIQQLLAAESLNPNKRHGQHFLIDLNLMRMLAGAAGINKSDVVLEVGCGTGSLTEELSNWAGAVIAAEIDGKLASIAQKQTADAGNVRIISEDILENKNAINGTVIDALRAARKELPGRILLVANLPYSVSTSVMLNLITGPVMADGMYVTVQKEVAERMTAGPGSDEYGTISIILGATGEAKTIRTLKPTVFWPQPQVDSAMISFIISKDKLARIHSIEMLSDVVDLFMGHRRKMLKACARFAAGRLSEIRNWGEIFSDCFIDPHLRPEQLSPDEYVSMANICFEELK